MGIEAVETALRDCYLSFGGEVVRRQDMLAVRSGVALPFFNGVPFSTHDRIEEVVAFFRGTPFRWWLTPSSRPEDLEVRLEEHGFRHVYDAPGMAIDLAGGVADSPSIEGFSIARVEDAAALRSWADVFAIGFKRPDDEIATWHAAYVELGFDGQWRHFVGMLDGEPVATSSVCISGDLAGIYHVVTLAPARGRGIGRAITAEALREGVRAGCRTGALQSSEMAFEMYQALGFRKCCDLRLYDWRPEYAD